MSAHIVAGDSDADHGRVDRKSRERIWWTIGFASLCWSPTVGIEASLYGLRWRLFVYVTAGELSPRLITVGAPKEGVKIW